jgi:hypothetical protein
MFRLNRHSLIERAYFGTVFFRKFRGFLGLFRNSAVCFGCFDIGLKHRNKTKQTEFFRFWFHETNETKPKQILLRFVSVLIEIFFVCVEDTVNYPLLDGKRGQHRKEIKQTANIILQLVEDRAVCVICT